MNKVEICGLNTATLKTQTEEEKRLLLERIKNGDSAAREELVLGNLRLVLSVIQRFRNKKETADDLFQVGCLGLLKAIDHFNLDLGVKFSTYAVPMIIGEIRRYLRDNNAMRVSRGLRDLAYRALQLREADAREGKPEPSLAELAVRLGVEEQEISHAMEAMIEPISLYDSVYNDGEDSMYVIDQLGDDGVSDDNYVEMLSLKEAIGKLNPRELDIIERRFYRGRTQMEIAAEIGISQAQVSRIEKAAVEKMKRYMQ